MTTALLQDLVDRGLDPARRRLFVIDGSKALRKAIAQVFGVGHSVQRCRNHKLRNVLGHLPKDEHPAGEGRDPRGLGSSMPRRACRSSSNWRGGSNATSRRPRRASERVCRRCSRSTSSAYHLG